MIFLLGNSDFNNAVKKSLQEKLAMIIRVSDPKDYEGGSTQLAIRDP